MTEHQFTGEHVGCHIDGRHGQQANDIRIVDLAKHYGWTFAYPVWDSLILEAARGGAIHVDLPAMPEEHVDAQSEVLVWEFMPELADDALGYLQSITEPFLIWEWVNGDLMLSD